MPMLCDAYNDFFIVMEATSPENNTAKNVEQVSQNGLSFLRFQTCLQDFYGRNRNRRLWPGRIVRQMSESTEVQELIKHGSFVGEAGHPVPDAGKVTINRIATINPNNTSHRITKLIWTNPNELHGIVETLDEGEGSPGRKFMRNILQGIDPAFSLRALVPQRKNPDGSIDVIGPGRMVCYDRVYLPSHDKAYIDAEIPVKNVVTKKQFEVVMESYTDFVTSHSDKIRTIIDNMEPVLETASYDPKSKMMSMDTAEGKVFISPEMKYRQSYEDLLSQF